MSKLEFIQTSTVSSFFYAETVSARATRCSYNSCMESLIRVEGEKGAEEGGREVRKRDN